MGLRRSRSGGQVDVVAVTLASLRRSNLAQLEALYVRAPAERVPRGVLRGVYLRRLAHRGARVPQVRWPQVLGFRLLSFGIDFDRRAWWFVCPRGCIGAFCATVGPSRWRATRAVTLRYDVSRLPARVRRTLYDELVPVAEGLYLGLGGLDGGPGAGDHFFFALVR